MARKSNPSKLANGASSQPSTSHPDPVLTTTPNDIVRVNIASLNEIKHALDDAVKDVSHTTTLPFIYRNLTMYKVFL